nr:Glutamyl-tRNA(Gln) amidotransferase and Asn Gln amidotransferase domain containing protein [Haemonchus contortus]
MLVALRPLPWRVLRRKLSKLAQLSREEFQPVIGLEVHVQLNTRTKLFSRAPCDSDAPPNSQVAAFDMATPGTLPMLNKSCVMHALRMAVLLNCEIPPYCRFDRKHYFYADMPAGYQITQSDQPVARNGRFTYSVYSEDIPSYNKEVRITQLQLEQDSGKTIHFGQSSLIDLNRAGAPLVEVVSEPDFSTALEAMCFVQQLRLLLMHHGICQGEMHKGHLRVDANVSLSHDGNKGVRTEVKNINSLRHLHTAINFEINRQYEVISSGNRVVNETRTCDEHGRTVSMRDKEEITDYRFIPEPNLPFLKIRPEWVDECMASVSSEPSYVKYQQLGFEPRRAVYYAESPELSRFVDLCADRLKNCGASEFVTWMNELKMMMRRSKAVYPPEDPEFAKQFMTIVEFHAQGRITKLRALETLRAFLSKIGDAKQLFNDNNLWRITDESTINKMMEEVLAKNEKLVQKASNGHAKSLTKLRNLLVDSSKKRIDSEQAENAIVARLNNLKSSSCSEE